MSVAAYVQRGRHQPQESRDSVSMVEQTPEIDFLPAALEIQERPPSPLGRAILWLIMGFFAATVAWACIGEVDIVATAEGTLVPSGRVKVIQPLEIGVVRAIGVTEGQYVEAGDVLIELDPTVSEAEHERLAKEHLANRLVGARLETLVHITEAAGENRHDGDDITIPGVEGASDQAIAIQRSILRAQWAEHRARVQGLDSAVASHQAKLAAIRENVRKLESTLPLITKRAQALKTLVGKHLASENAWLELEQERLEQQQDLAALTKQVQQVSASIEETRKQKEAVHAEFKRSVFTDLAGVQQRIEILEQELIKARQRTMLQSLTAPISGVIQQLAVHTVGGVVTPAQELMRVVPQDDRLEVEAWIQNKDIGFVEEGDAVEVKVDAFPFTKYGTVPGTLDELSNDAISDKELGAVYAAQVALAAASIQVEDKHLDLSAGMTVTVEVKTGERRIIEYLLSPLLRYRQESIRER